jgi:hypothetical protein
MDTPLPRLDNMSSAAWRSRLYAAPAELCVPALVTVLPWPPAPAGRPTRVHYGKSTLDRNATYRRPPATNVYAAYWSLILGLLELTALLCEFLLSLRLTSEF